MLGAPLPTLEGGRIPGSAAHLAARPRQDVRRGTKEKASQVVSVLEFQDPQGFPVRITAAAALRIHTAQQCLAGCDNRQPWDGVAANSR